MRDSDQIGFAFCSGLREEMRMVSDIVMGHNPLAAVYLSRGPYHGRLRVVEDKTGKGEKVDLRSKK